MKILCYRGSSDFYFESIISCLSNIKSDRFKIGYLSGEINTKMISDFAPDVIIHNIEGVNKFPTSQNTVSININETDGSNSFSFKKQGKNFLKPFVNLKDIHINENEKVKFLSDVVYIGSPSQFGDILSFLIDKDSGILFKFFTHIPHNINGYCGMCDSADYFKFYNSSKASLVKHDDKQRLMDITISNGNPIVFNKENHKECIESIKEAVFNNKKYTVPGYDSGSIFNNDTSFDRAYQIFKTVGLNKFADEIIKTKKIQWDKK